MEVWRGECRGCGGVEVWRGECRGCGGDSGGVEGTVWRGQCGGMEGVVWRGECGGVKESVEVWRGQCGGMEGTVDLHLVVLCGFVLAASAK